jgi:hypothetical protein
MHFFSNICNMAILGFTALNNSYLKLKSNFILLQFFPTLDTKDDKIFCQAWPFGTSLSFRLANWAKHRYHLGKCDKVWQKWLDDVTCSVVGAPVLADGLRVAADGDVVPAGVGRRLRHHCLWWRSSIWRQKFCFFLIRLIFLFIVRNLFDHFR